MNPYAVLGIDKNAGTAEVKSAFRSLAKRFHPDHPGGDAQKFQEIREAYDAITHPGASLFKNFFSQTIVQPKPGACLICHGSGFVPRKLGLFTQCVPCACKRKEKS